jgi:hypothetical protein
MKFKNCNNWEEIDNRVYNIVFHNPSLTITEISRNLRDTITQARKDREEFIRKRQIANTTLNNSIS